MRKFLIFFCVALTVCFSCIPAFAENETDFASMVYVDGYGYMTYEEYLAYVPADTSAEPVSSPALEVDSVTAEALVDAAIAKYAESTAAASDEPAESVALDDSIVDSDIALTSLPPVTPSDSNGFKAVLLSLVGNYDPVVVEHSYTTNNGYVNKTVEISPDYAWLASAAIVLVLCYCIFKAGGAVLCKR